jgi:hypothetical protein
MARARLAFAVSIVGIVALVGDRAGAAPLDPIAGEQASSLTLSLKGALRGSSDGRRESLAQVTLTVPLERIGAPRLAQASGGAGAEGAATPGAPKEPEAAAPVPPAPRRRAVELALSPMLARAALRVALRTAGFPENRARLYSLKSRARSSAIFPTLRLRAARTTDESLRLTPTIDDPYRYTQAGGASLLFEARMDWKLDRLIFADEELGIERLQNDRANAEARLADRVLKLLVAWQRGRLRAGDTTLEPEQRALAALEALEAEIYLDLLTDGWFSEQPQVVQEPVEY